ncbi:MAG: alpha/beta fold hydrolase [Rhodospirillales bacterium]|nr:MAG: alpha/beta fold hydrolase [Rhodospirillales bacterium]
MPPRRVATAVATVSITSGLTKGVLLNTVHLYSGSAQPWRQRVRPLISNGTCRILRHVRILPFVAFLPAFGALSDMATANQAATWPNLAMPTLGGRQLWADRYFHAGWRIQENVLTGHARLLDPSDIRRCWGPYDACRAAFERIRAERDIPPNGKHLVVLLHGLGRSRASFKGLQRALAEAGHEVAAIGYPSTRRDLAANAAVLEDLLADLPGVERISFVTHSLGGLLVRELLARDSDWRGRIAVDSLVMIAPPNRGSAMADVLQYVPPINLLLWRGLFCATTRHATGLPVPDVPFGIVAAGRSGTGYNPFLDGDDDLIVRVAETSLDGAADWLQVRGLHAVVMNAPQTVQAVLDFLEFRRFEHQN